METPLLENQGTNPCGVPRAINNPKKGPHMANKNTNPGISESAYSGVCGYIVLRALPIARWDERDAWDNSFLKFALRAPRRI